MNDSLLELIKDFQPDNMRCSEYRIKNSLEPIIFYFTPGNFTSTRKRTPNICAFLKQGKEILNFETSKLYLDNKEMKTSSDSFNIGCLPEDPLNYGTHIVKLIINDKEGSPQEFIWSFLVEDELVEYNFYYGVPHSHTSYSDGMGTPSEAYEKAKSNGLNFLIVTDHQGKLAIGKHNHDESILISGPSHPKWEMLKLEAAAANNRYNNFIALFGFELSTNFWGHINIINSERIISKKPSSLEELYKWLVTEENILISINHPYRSPKTRPFSYNFDNFVNLYEVGNGSTTRIYTRAEGNYYNALDDGWHIAAINGQDNHSSDWGDSSNVTAVISKELTIDSLINAIKLRRVYSTESRSLKLVVKGNNHWMGSILNLNIGDKLDLHIIAEDDINPIEKVQVITNDGKILEEKVFNSVKNIHWNLNIDICEEYSWYVVKVIHSDEKIGISSALFVQSFDLS